MLIILEICIMCFCNCCLKSISTPPEWACPHSIQPCLIAQCGSPKVTPTGPEALTSVSAWDGSAMSHQHAVSPFRPFTSAPVRHYWQVHLRYKTQLRSSVPEHLICRSDDGKSLSDSLKNALNNLNSIAASCCSLKSKQDKEAVSLLTACCFKS